MAEEDEWSEGRRVPRGELGRLLRRISPRDRMLLTLLGEHGYLTTKDVEALLFPSLRMAELRLRQLRPPIAKRDRHGTVVKLSNEHGLGLVMRWARLDPMAGAWRRLSGVYLLRQKGALVLAAMRGEDSARWVQRSYNAAEFAMQLDHDLGVTGFFTSLAQASKELPDQGLYKWTGEATMRSRYKEEGGDLAPDGWGHYLASDREVVFQLEWDVGTEPAGILTSKAAGYGTYSKERDHDGETNHVLWVADRESRERTLREAIERAEPDDRYVSHWLSTAPHLKETGPLGGAWRPLQSGDRVALPQMAGRPLTDLKVEDCLGKPGWWDRREEVP